jgi:hypothetical protein
VDTNKIKYPILVFQKYTSIEQMRQCGYVLGSHGLDHELLHLTDSSGSSLLEGDTVQTRTHVDGVVTGDNISLRLSLGSVVLLSHLVNNNVNKKREEYITDCRQNRGSKRGNRYIGL